MEVDHELWSWNRAKTLEKELLIQNIAKRKYKEAISRRQLNQEGKIKEEEEQQKEDFWRSITSYGAGIGLKR